MRDAPDNATPTAHGFACDVKSSEQPLGGGAPMGAGKLTVFTSEQPATLGKVFSLKSDGTLQKEVAGHMVVGTYEVREFSTAADLVALLSTVTTSQAISASLPLEALPQSGPVVSSKLLAANPGAVTRSKSNFEFRSNTPGILTIDYDPQPGDVVLSPEELWSFLQNTIGGLATAGVVHWLSGSSHIWTGETELQGRRGQRFYILVTDAGDIPRACETLAARLWLARRGRVVLSKSGAKLVRDLFDHAMKEAARLDFCGGAICQPPLEQRRGSPVVLSAGGFLDTRAALPDLTASEQARVEGLQQIAKDGAEREAAEMREAWERARGDTLTTRLVGAGVPVPEAHERGKQAARSAIGGTLLGDYSIILEDGEEVSVAQLLANIDRYHGAICRDPLEPDYLGGKATGKVYLHGAAPVIHSFAHGKTTYRLRRQPVRIFLKAGRRAETASEIMEKLAGEDDLFMRGGFLVRLEGGRLLPIKRPSALSYLVGLRYALFKHARDGAAIAADLDDQTAGMLLSALEVE